MEKEKRTCKHPIPIGMAADDLVDIPIPMVERYIRTHIRHIRDEDCGECLEELIEEMGKKSHEQLLRAIRTLLLLKR